MSNYRQEAFNPDTNKIENADFVDGHFGRHIYGVTFDGVKFWHTFDVGLFGTERRMKTLLARVAELEAALRDLLDLQYAKNELRTLDRGVGTATDNAAWLRARAALSTTNLCTDSSDRGGGS